MERMVKAKHKETLFALLLLTRDSIIVCCTLSKRYRTYAIKHNI
jgi:hypothetical protein